MKIDTDKIEEAYDSLPESLKSVLDSRETARTISDIGKKYSLHIDQLGKMAIVVRGIISGVVPRQNFLNQLREGTGLPEDVINLLVYDLNQQIFSKIREELQKSPTQIIADKSNSPSPQQIFEQKMEGISNVPKQKVEVKAETGDNKVEVANSKPPRDPYREPID